MSTDEVEVSKATEDISVALGPVIQSFREVRDYGRKVRDDIQDKTLRYVGSEPEDSGQAEPVAQPNTVVAELSKLSEDLRNLLDDIHQCAERL